MFYVCPTLSTHWCPRLKIQCPPPCLRNKITSFLCSRFEKSLLLIQSYKCLLMVLRGMSKAGCFLFEFSYAATEKSFQQVFLTLNSFSNNTSYTYMHIHRYEYIYISFVQVIAFCGVGYFKGLKHSIFKSCHQIPTSVIGTWCFQLFTVCCLFKNVKYFSKNVIFGRSKAQKS